MSIADCSTIQPELFGSSSKTMLSQSSYSSDTGDFMREATKKLSYYDDPFSTQIFTRGNVPSEDEVSFPFSSANSSRHSLIVLLSPTLRENDGTVLRDSSSCSSADEPAGMPTNEMESRVRKNSNLGRNSHVKQFSGNQVESMNHAPNESEGGDQVMEHLSSEDLVKDEAVTDKVGDNYLEQPKKPKRRERRHAMASYLINPLQLPGQQLSESPFSNERKEDNGEGISDDNVPPTPRQRKTYSMEDRLQNPLSMQLKLEELSASSKGDDDDSTPLKDTPPGHVKPHFDFDDGLDMYPNPPGSPGLPASPTPPAVMENQFFDNLDVGNEGLLASCDYQSQSQLEGIRASTEHFFGREGSEDMEGVGGDSGDIIDSLLAQYPHFSQYPTSSLLAISSFASRKMSDSAVITKRDRSTVSHLPHQRHRCVSDSAAPHIVLDDDKNSEVGGWSHVYCDSGYNDEKSSRCHGSSSSAYITSPRVSLYSSDLLSQEEGMEGSHSSHSKPHRRLTPYMAGIQIREEGGVGQDELPLQLNTGQTCSTGTMVRPRERSRRSLIKNFSQSSLGASSAGTGGSSDTVSLTSLFESQSPETVTDMLSNLGFDDFNSPQLIPDRFIPKEVEHAKPSIMRTMTLSEYNSRDSPSNSHYSSYEPSLASTSYSAPIPYSHLQTSTSSQYHNVHSTSSASLPGNYSLSCARNNSPPLDDRPNCNIISDPCATDLPLGATAENFLATRSSSPPPPAQSSKTQQPSSEREAQTRNLDSRYPCSNLTTVGLGFHRGRLETVPEETASDLSPSPRWLSPRVSVDHSVNFDVAEGKLGASLNIQKVRKRSLPTQRDGYKLSVGSLVESDTGGDSIHFSVTSYDDEVAAEREKEREDTLPHLTLEELSIHQQQRRRRRGVYTPPPALLTWLSQQQPIHEEDVTDPDELPWPFNEQARLRKSLTEIQLAQMALDSSDPAAENRDTVSGSHTSGSSKADGYSSMSSSPPSSIPRSSPGPSEEDPQEDINGASSKIITGTFPLRRHSRDNSTSSFRPSYRTRSLSCQSDYHLLRKEIESLSSHVGGEDGLLKIEIEELRYTMSASQRRLSRALALKGDQLRQLQEVANQT